MTTPETSRPRDHGPGATDASGRGAPASFGEVAKHVAYRLARARWFALLGAYAPVTFGLALLTVVPLHLVGLDQLGLAVASVLALAWVLGTAACAWWSRPVSVQALAEWDRRRQRHEMFASAYCFEAAGAEDLPRAIHLSRARARLTSDWPGLRRDVPAPLPSAAWLSPLLFLAAFALIAFMLPPIHGAVSDPFAADMARVREVGGKLDQKSRILDRLDGLEEEEKEKIDKLKEDLEKTARKLKELDSASEREVLEELEKRAREAEKLAESLGAGGGQSLSSPMIEEMERHADTAELGEALRAEALEKVAEEAGDIGGKLQSDELTIEARDRMTNVLDKVMDAADAQDKRSFVGREMGEAEQQMEQKQPDAAAENFENIAEHFRRMAQRRAAQERLEQLAQSLRGAGRQMFGQQGGGMRRLQAVRGSNLRPMQMPGAGLMMPLPGRQRAGQQPPGAGLLPLGGLPGGMPIPGMPGMGQRPGMAPGQTPIPGACSACNGAGCSGCNGGASNSLSNSPSNSWGVGSAPLVPNRTNPMAPSDTGVVSAGAAGEGESMFQEVDAGPHRERARREARDLAVQFLNAEEEALADDPLPLTRQQQVLRYFTAVRQQLANQP